MNYRAEIDGLRALAVLPVVAFHAKIWPFSGGFAGVDVFFVISGYLISTILLNAADKGGISIATFYERRARRILPALFVMTLVTIPFAWQWLLPNQLSKYSLDLSGVAFFVSNILFWQRTNYFEPLAEENPLLHIWSLGVEEQFYLLFPIFLILVLRFRPNWLMGLLLIGMIGSLGLSEWGWRYAAVANFYLLPTRAWELGAGVLCALFLRRDFIRPHAGLGLVGVLAVLTSMVVFTEESPWPSLITLLPVVGTALIILFARGNVVARGLGSAPLRYIGLMSFSIYLWHMPLLAFTYAYLPASPDPQDLALMAVLSLPLGYLSWQFIEKPFRKPIGDGGKVPLKTFVVLMSVCVSLLVGFTIYGRMTQGGLNRFAEADRPLLHLLETRKIRGYILSAYKKHELFPFEDGKVKVFFVGDSFGQDIFNTMRENDFFNGMSVSTYIIPKHCGNLLVERDLEPLRDRSYRDICRTYRSIHDKKIQARIREADYVIQASHWRDWQIPLLPESYANISALTDAKILLFTSKRFERLKAYQLASYDRKTRGDLRFPMHPFQQRRVRNMLALDLPVIDQSGLICESDSDCRLFTPDGDAISYDGRHFTPAGAKWVGQLLYEKAPLYRDMVDRAKEAAAKP